jgi:cathepsin F
MKREISIFLYTAVLGLVSSLSDGHATKADFLSWAKRHGKSYADNATTERRFQIWVSNMAAVDEINSSNMTWKATIENKFGDVTPKEFNEMMLMKPFHKPAATHMKAARKPSLKTATAGSFDWRDYGAVTQVQDQGTVGSCWAFSTIGSVEGQWFLEKDELVDLSEEYLVDCDGESDETHADCGVFGGWPYLAYEFILETGGVPTEATYPYCSGTGDCYPCMLGPISLCGLPPSYCDHNITLACPDAQLYASIADWTDISTDEAQIAQQLVDIGPLSALLDATQLQFYDSGIWTGKVDGSSALLGCHADSLDHAVLLVGYGTEDGTDYWTVKNSWGEGFGEQGYFRILRGQGTCGINTAVTSALR